MKKYKTKRWRLTITSEEYLVYILNKIRKRKDILNHKGYFKLSTLKEYADGKHYVNFYRPKKKGGFRLISSPQRNLRYIQTCIAVLFNSIYRPNENTFGFIDGKSIVDNASKHINKDIVYNIDLKDFFGQIHFGRVRGMLMKPPYSIGEEAATTIAQIACLNGILPQGAPSSPVITNMICVPLDNALMRLAKKTPS